MEQIIKITTNDKGDSLVSARELYEFLGISKRFSAWFETYKSEDYGFLEYEDFTSVLSSTVVNNGAVRELKDYAITIEMAKELSMLSKSPKGKQARKYFLECEKKLKQNKLNDKKLPNDYLSALKALVASEEEKIKLKAENEKKGKFINQISISDNSLLVREVAKIASKNNIKIGEKRLWDKLRDWGMIFKNSTEPKQMFIDRGYFEVVEGVRTTRDKTFTYHTTRVTGKGQTYIINRLLKEA